MKRARITELAESDLAKIWLYIARDNPDAADHFIDKLRAECHRLAAAPHRGRPRPEFAVDLRSYRAGNYFLFYFPTDSPASKWLVCSTVPVICREYFSQKLIFVKCSAKDIAHAMAQFDDDPRGDRMKDRLQESPRLRGGLGARAVCLSPVPICGGHAAEHCEPS